MLYGKKLHDWHMSKWMSGDNLTSTHSRLDSVPFYGFQAIGQIK